MGRKATAGGVEVRDNSIRIAFTWHGKTCRETLREGGVELAPTASNEKYAKRLRKEIVDTIAAGNFKYGDYFPDSPHAEKVIVNTFGSLADDWLKAKGQLEAGTLDKYRLSVAFWKRKIGADKPLPSITYQFLAGLIGAHSWPSGKSANNQLIVLRGIMGFEFIGPRAGSNPMIGIKNLKVVKRLPDPLTAAERDMILADMAKHYDLRVVSYFKLMFFTGLRPEESIALQWGDWDQNHQTIRIQRVRTFKGSERDGSKTNTVRDVDLVPQAIEALIEMKAHTFMKRDDIFENPVTSKPWHSEASQRDHYWKPCLKRLGIRQRRCYVTRATYATVGLMGRVNPAYVAAQLGHTDAKMLFEKYAKWINGADHGAERRAMAAASQSTDNQMKEVAQ